ncbi:MAG: DNA-processing protein DprA [bacterium]
MLKTNTYLLFLNQFLFDNPALLQKIAKRYPSLESFQRNETSIIPHLSPSKQTHYMYTKKTFNAEKYLEKLHALGITCLDIQNPLYPQQLKEIHTPPLLLYCKGNLEQLQQDLIAIVGTRNPSHYGTDCCTHFTKTLCHYFGIISGLAAGIDSHALRTCLSEKKGCIAVIGTGLDIIYPKINVSLSKEISEKGLILSEFPLGTKGLAHHFPQRNRIISGLCKGILVCEGKQKSGSLITANYAIEQNKDVFTIPGNIFSDLSEGPNGLIKEGAKLCQSPQDILDEYNILLKEQPNIISKNKRTSNLNEKEIQLLTLLDEPENSIDSLLEKTGYPLTTLLQTLSFLEIQGFIKTTNNQHYKRI